MEDILEENFIYIQEKKDQPIKFYMNGEFWRDENINK
jgi:hypothetical protein